eukprot:6199678-Pleurochrysis_carterae.AAC.1
MDMGYNHVRWAVTAAAKESSVHILALGRVLDIDQSAGLSAMLCYGCKLMRIWQHSRRFLAAFKMTSNSLLDLFDNSRDAAGVLARIWLKPEHGALLISTEVLVSMKLVTTSVRAWHVLQRPQQQRTLDVFYFMSTY